MDIRKRLISKFLFQFLLVFVIVSLLVYGFLFFLEFRNSTFQNGTEPSRLFKELQNAASISGNAVVINPNILRQVENGHGWLQLLDPQGNELYRFRMPASLPKHYSPGELVYYHQFPQSFGSQIYTWLDQRKGLSYTWIYGIPFQEAGKAVFGKGDKPFTINVLLIGFMAVVFMSLIYSFQLAGPLLHMLDWVRNISKGNYIEPADRNGNPRSRHPFTQQLRRSYRIYRELIDSLEQTTAVLRKSDEERRRLEQSREEWIAGVSHDLKTPLSSVKGYATLLSTSQYEWDKEEVDRFIQVIHDKADYMDQLIDDLSLTFRLKNQALPLQIEPQNLVKWVRRSVIDLIQHPGSGEQTVLLDCDENSEIVYPIDGKWFKRAVDNFLMNASLHNPPGTCITVGIESTGSKDAQYSGVIISIADNGKGMDEETVRRLFDRYYRGTNTSDPRGTGSGLGTAIARQLIEAQQGSISVISAPGKGTKICISFPQKS